MIRYRPSTTVSAFPPLLVLSPTKYGFLSAFVGVVTNKIRFLTIPPLLVLSPTKYGFLPFRKKKD
jgi:hypothetical protein